MESSRPAIRIDLNDFKLHLHFKSKTQLTLHFNSPSRRFYLSVIALVVSEMKRLGKIKSISLQDHLALLALLNESVGGAAGSSDKENLLPRVYHLWAERYDRDLKDIFALQDEITMKILTATQVKLTLGDQASRVEKYFKGKEGLDCYLKYLEGCKYNLGHNIDDNRMAQRIAEEVIALCPENPAGYVLLAWVHQIGFWVGSGKSPQDSIEKGIEIVKKALIMDDSIARAHALLGNLYALKREFEKALFEGERAIALDPGEAESQLWYGMSLVYVGRPEEAIPLYQKAIQLNPFASTGYYIHLANSLRDAKRFEEAVSAYRKAIQREPNNIFAHLNLAGTYIMMGRETEARAEAAEVLRINPKFTLEFWAKVLPYKDQSVSDNLIDVLRKAGLK